jgi:DsbC/DsbD-like thiol-disulfide interchange protein/cytochrome c biogenesis protein CcdA
MRASTIHVLRSLLALLLAVMAAQPVTAQRANHIAAELVAEGPATPGETLDIALLMTPEPTWHGYWSNPGDAGLGIDFGWTLPAGWTAGEPEYPVPQTLLISGLMNHVYEGQYAVLVPFTVPADARPGSVVPVTLEAQWLACTDQVCVPERGTLTASIAVGGDGAREPRFDGWRAAIPALIDQKGSFELARDKLRIGIPLPASLEIAAPHVFTYNEELVAYAAPQAFWRDGDLLIVELDLKQGAVAPERVSGILKLDDTGNGVRFEAQPGEVPRGGTRLGTDTGELPALWLLLAMALAGGLLLNIMPCVFPILSLKAMSLARANESEAAARRDGLAYTAGVVLACLALGGLMLALRAGGSEIGWAFQLQEPGVVVALLVLAVAITANFAGLFELPSLSVTSDKPFGAFATGLLAAFVATPCTGPFMAAAMGAALLLPPEQALLLFAALGLGIALPFLLLGFVPPLRKLLPRPGAWMTTFRKVMAVPMGLTALALLWLCWQIGGAWFAIAGLLLAMALVALVKQLQRRSWPSAVFFLFVAVMILVDLPSRYAPPSQTAEQGLIPAKPFSEAALAEARATGKPVFVWFTADWCLTCKVNEGVAIEREATREAFEKAGVIAIKGDWTRRDAEITRFLTAQGVGGIPLYLWYPAGGGQPQQLPQLLTPDSLVTLAEGD